LTCRTPTRFLNTLRNTALTMLQEQYKGTAGGISCASTKAWNQATNSKEVTRTSNKEHLSKRCFAELQPSLYVYEIALYNLRLSSNFTDLVYLNTISKLSHPPSLMICSTSNPALCRLEANVLLNVCGLQLSLVRS